MTQPALRPPSYLQPRPKAAPTFSSTSLDAIVTKKTPPSSRASSRARQLSPSRPPLATDVSDKATSALIRRVLCPHSHGGTSDSRPIDEVLPPLTSSNDVDLQLYAIIAIVVKEFVYSWYGKITPDQGFVEEVVRIFAHCTRALEQRLRRVDIEGLVFDEVPELVESHVFAWRTSHASQHSSPFAPDPRVVYHTLIPHPAFQPIPDRNDPSTTLEQVKNEAAYRQLLVQGVLAVLLPTEDLNNACLRTLVADIVGEMILGNGIGGKACEGWLIWQGITKIVENVQARVQANATGEEMDVDTRSRLEKFGLLSGQVEHGRRHVTHTRSSTPSEIFWRVLQHAYLAFVTLRFIVLGVVAALSESSRSSSTFYTLLDGGDPSPTAPPMNAPTPKRPLLGFTVFTLISSVLDLSIRMPWLCGIFSLFQYHLIRSWPRLGATNGGLDLFLHHLIRKHILPTTLLPPLLHTLRTTLFPHNTLAPPSPVPSPTQQLAAKRKCAETILDTVPPRIAGRFLAVGTAAGEGNDARAREKMVAEVEGILDVFGDSYMNKHLVFGIVELVLVRLVPELGENGVGELMAMRLGGE
ncbi:hypothetical protein MMC06_002882 [Schaereria dolodes]|nr:hypothetical protein [Schaereria dolodes]